MGECNSILSAYTKYRHLGYYCTHPTIFKKTLSALVQSYQGDSSPVYVCRWFYEYQARTL